MSPSLIIDQKGFNRLLNALRHEFINFNILTKISKPIILTYHI